VVNFSPLREKNLTFSFFSCTFALYKRLACENKVFPQILFAKRETKITQYFPLKIKRSLVLCPLLQGRAPIASNVMAAWRSGG
jgi:hypothetical protein